MARGNPVPIMGVWLRRLGDHVIVSVETPDGRDIEVIRERHDGSFSHNISEHGLQTCLGTGDALRLKEIHARLEAATHQLAHLHMEQISEFLAHAPSDMRWLIDQLTGKKSEPVH